MHWGISEHLQFVLLRGCCCREVMWTEPLALRHWGEHGSWCNSALWEVKGKVRTVLTEHPVLCTVSVPPPSSSGLSGRKLLQEGGSAALERRRKAEKWDRMGIVWLWLSLPRG